MDIQSRFENISLNCVFAIVDFVGFKGARNVFVCAEFKYIRINSFLWVRFKVLQKYVKGFEMIFAV